MTSRFVNPRSSTRKSDYTMDDDTDDKDDTKRKTRNLSEKKRRDQFNLLINELSSMVTTNNRKMDKSTVLKSTISFLKNHNDIAVQSRANEIQEDWKPSFLTNEEFTHLFLEALDGFIIVLSSSGRIIYSSESITSLLGYFPNDLLTMTVYDIIHEGDHSEIYNILLNPSIDFESEGELSFVCHCKRGGGIDVKDVTYEIVEFHGQFKNDVDSLHVDGSGDGSRGTRYSTYSPEDDTRVIFVGTGRLQTPQLLRELSVIDSTKSEFTSRHSLEWKFLFLDHRAPPIIGYLPFEVLGTSGYDYYHVDDLDSVVTCHEALMQKGEGTSCYYRFLTKGQQWIWLQTRFYITYHQWNSKPEFIVCTHRVVSYLNVLKQSGCGDSDKGKSFSRHSPWSLKSANGGSKRDKGATIDHNSSFDSVQVPKHSQNTSFSVCSRQSRKSRGSDSVSVRETNNCSLPVQPPLQQQHQHVSNQYVPLSDQHSSSRPPLSVVSGLTSSLNSLPPQRLDLLERRQEELQQRIVEQQTELRQVTEQLFMAKYGLLPPVLNVTLPYTVGLSSPELYITHNTAVAQHHHHSSAIPQQPIVEDAQHQIHGSNVSTDPYLDPQSILYDPSTTVQSSPNSTMTSH